MRKTKKSIVLFVLWIVGVTLIETFLSVVTLEVRYSDKEVWFYPLMCLVVAIIRIPMLLWIIKCARKENVRWLEILSKIIAIFTSLVLGIMFVASMVIALTS